MVLEKHEQWTSVTSDLKIEVGTKIDFGHIFLVYILHDVDQIRVIFPVIFP